MKIEELIVIQTIKRIIFESLLTKKYNGSGKYEYHEDWPCVFRKELTYNDNSWISPNEKCIRIGYNTLQSELKKKIELTDNVAKNIIEKLISQNLLEGDFLFFSISKKGLDRLRISDK